MRLKKRSVLEKAYIERDAIRWLMQDYKKANASMINVIETGIDSADWEMQIVCMIACAHFGLNQFQHKIQHTKLRFNSTHLYDRDANQWALEIQQAIVNYLGHDDLPNIKGRASYNDREKYILHCILREKIDKVTDLFMFTNGLRIPNGIKPIVPHRPAGIRLIDGKFYLHDSNIEFVYVPSFKHWLGSEKVADNPIQHTFIKTGFFITKFPLSIKTNGNPTKDNYVYLNYQDTKGLVNALSKKYNTKLIIPSVNTSEMASRGQTGRKFPWGNKLEEKAYNVSPWLMEEALGSVEWWTSSKYDENNNYTYGSWKQKNCAGRVIAPHLFKRAVRVAISGVFVK